MSIDDAKLAARREGLVRRSEELRAMISDDVAAISKHLRVVDNATTFVRSGGGRAIVWGGLVLLMMSGPGRAFKLASRTAFTWSLARRWLPRVLALKRGQRRV